MGKNNYILLGTTERGKSHIYTKTPNQDFYRFKKDKFGYAMCVCDGVGSNKYSKYGSRAACKAALIVYDLYNKGIIKEENIGKTIEKYYKKNVNKNKREEAATTCLFVYLFKNNKIIIGQAGDGAILFKKNQNFGMFKCKDDDFMNEVNPLSCKYECTSWMIKSFNFDFEKNESISFILTTDGISEDIIPDHREEFLDFYIEECTKNGKKFLKKAIKEWPVPGSSDDKTIVVFNWRNKNESNS